MKFNTIATLLVCALLAFATVRAEEQSASNIKLGLFEDSNSHWIAINVQDGSMDTTAVQMRDNADGADWATMKYVDGWAHWVANSDNEYTFPLSFRLTSKAEQEIVVENIISELGAQVVDTGVQYAEPRVEARRKSSKGRVTKAPTSKPSTPTSKPNTPTSKPVTPTSKPVTPSGGKMGMIVPLYTYPGSTWDTVLASASKVRTVAIINPNSGPGTGPDSTYKTYMKKMQAGGVELVGYVHTSYGARSIADVKADINKYASEFPEVTGIFIDEAAATADKVSYYTQVHQYIMSMPGYKYNILNPGTAPTQSYFSISTQIVSFEDTATKFTASANPAYANSGNKDHFSVIAYGATSSQMLAGVATAKSKAYYGWIYWTDKTCCTGTYNSLPSYYAQMAAAVGSA